MAGRGPKALGDPGLWWWRPDNARDWQSPGSDSPANSEQVYPWSNSPTLKEIRNFLGCSGKKNAHKPAQHTAPVALTTLATPRGWGFEAGLREAR